MQAADGSALSRDLLILVSLFLLVIGSSAPLMNVGAQEGTSALTVVAKDMEDHDLIGKYVELRYNDTIVGSGFVPHTFTVTDSQQYQLGIADYRRYIFDHWADTGSSDRWRSVTVTEDTTLVAIYRVVIEDPPTATTAGGSTSPQPSGGSGGGGQRPSVIILSPENGEPVNPASFGVYGVTIGFPTSVEIAVANPNTGSTSQYRPVTPVSPGDYSRWSYSLSVSDLTMTQVKVKATFPNAGERQAAVEVYYYVPGGSGTSATNSFVGNESTGRSIISLATAGVHKTVSLYSSIRIADKSGNLAVTSSPAATDPPKVPDKSPDIASTPSGTEASDSASGGNPGYLLVLVILALAASAGIALLSLRRRIAVR